MKMRMKLFLTFFAFGVVIFLLSNQTITEFAVGSGSTGRQLAVSFVAVCAIAGFSYLLAITFCRRLEVLAGQSQNAITHRTSSYVETAGSRDEIYEIAQSVNKLKTQLTEGEDIRNRLVADVAHELRTPIAILRGHLETILSGGIELDRDHLLPLLDETKRMSRLIQDMQDLNLAEAGKLSLDRSWTPFGSNLEEIVSILEIEAEAKSITLHLEGEGDRELYGDTLRIKQVFINLLGNAVRYTPEGGQVDVRYTYLDGQMVVTVSDNGPGIAPESLPYIFKRFYRVEGSRNRASGGTGLGLAIAKQFVEVHGGTIYVESEPGVGTVFTVSLPVYPPNP
ncbi:HAMP domain-containing sensor histidine kinase [Paenibacillus sp. LHD-117]|uniref:sensor histidine kinase n=1 Tax=Paenibacillus sp. LHD-117 TaxID=3071412 RepID=UPI0027E0B1E9|nr:HAMP domain-containing sensor histidine kinase [Paenibacillus sp. LHD-117]MDQ6423647.1 HAMP domain-containing sensor histidine kinase [Paenibacillus sp. LHD-117]